ncbi:MAG: tetratricopeptide repeat protein [Pseudomonadota bacterium]
MPPPRIPPKREEIFVNRVGPLKIFEEAAFAIPKDSARILTFYGVGGQGKTTLCRRIMRRAGPDGDQIYDFLRTAELDLHGRSKSDPDLLLVWIRNAFAKSGVALPAFDIALAVVWETTRAELPFPRLDNAWLATSSDAISQTIPETVQTIREALEQTAETIPGLGLLLTKGSKWVIDKTKRSYLERSRNHLSELYRQGQLKKPYELSALLPWMLAQDLNYHLAQHPGERFLLLVDEYERVFDEGGAGAKWRENVFDKHVRKLVAETNGLLAVFFSRERLPWDDDPDWRSDLEGNQHLLGGLTAIDAEEWLKQVPVEMENIRQAMLDGAREEPKPNAPVYPFLLDLQIEHWQALQAKGSEIFSTDFDVKAETFMGRCRELVERVLRDYGQGLQYTIQRLSIANRFDRTAFEYIVSEFGTGLANDSFEQVSVLSFVSRADDDFFTLHRAIADVVSTTLSEERRRETIERLLAHFSDRAAFASPRDITSDAVNCLFEAAYLRRLIGAEGYVDWLAPLASAIHGAALYAAAEQLWQDALALSESELGHDHPSTATSYNNVASNLNAQGRYEEAEPLYNKGLEISERVLGHDHPLTAASYNNVAYNLNDQGRYEEAEPL